MGYWDSQYPTLRGIIFPPELQRRALAKQAPLAREGVRGAPHPQPLAGEVDTLKPRATYTYESTLFPHSYSFAPC
jgi:hypothetical protein